MACDHSSPPFSNINVHSLIIPRPTPKSKISIYLTSLFPVLSFRPYQPPVSSLHSLPPLLNRFQISLPHNLLHNISLLIQHKSISLLPNLSQSSPSLEIFWIAFVTMSFLGVLPMPLTEYEECCNFLVGDVVD